MKKQMILIAICAALLLGGGMAVQAQSGPDDTDSNLRSSFAGWWDGGPGAIRSGTGQRV